MFNDTDSDIDTMSTGGTSDSSFSEHRVWGTRQESDDDSIIGLFKVHIISIGLLTLKALNF